MMSTCSILERVGWMGTAKDFLEVRHVGGLHLIEHYGSGIRRIKNECTKNGNKPPEWSQQYGSFITVYESRLGRDTINEGINNGHEGINEGINEGIRTVLDLIRVRPGINAPEIASLMSKGLSTVERIISEGIKRGEIEHRGSKKTGGYYVVK